MRSLETAWRDETGAIRDLYQGILQVAVTYLHITRGNYDGVTVKVYGRSLKWLHGWSDICRGIHVKKIRDDGSCHDGTTTPGQGWDQHVRSCPLQADPME